MAAGCCGVKKQKLNGNAVAVVNYGPTNSAGNNGSYGCLRARPNRYVHKDMCLYCFEVLHHYLNCADPPKQPKFPNVDFACKDGRFSPISPEEFSRLHCSVSLLMDFEPAADYLDWEVGCHGIRIEFTNDKGAKKAATYLPEVALEQGWNHVQAIDSLLRKGGFKGPITQEIRLSMSITRFQAEKMSASYTEFVSSRSAQALSYQNGLLSGPFSGKGRRHQRHNGLPLPAPEPEADQRYRRSSPHGTVTRHLRSTFIAGAAPGIANGHLTSSQYGIPALAPLCAFESDTPTPYHHSGGDEDRTSIPGTFSDDSPSCSYSSY